MLKKVRIAAKTFGGFGVVIALLLVVSAIGGFNLLNGNENFKRYRAIAIEAVQAGRVQANLLEARMAVKNFVIYASEENIATVKERANRTLELNSTLEAMIDSPDKDKIIAQTDTNLKTYLAAFDEVTKLQARRDGLVANTLDRIGPQIEKKLTSIMESARADDDTVAAFRAGVVQRNTLLMRLYATKFLDTNDAAAYQRAIAESGEMAKNHVAMLAELQNPARRKLASEIAELHKTYEAGVTSVFEVINRRNELISGTLDMIGPKVAADMENLKLGIKKEQDTLGPSASAAMDQAVTVMLTVAGISLLLGGLAAWLIGIGISRPIQAITGSMKALANGDKEVSIPGQDHGDEIGDMAAAVHVFKENMIKADELAAREAEERAVREKRTQLIEHLTCEFDKEVSELLGAVASASTEMEGTASSMSSIADDTNKRATTVASAAEQASANVQTVATATEEMSSSIREISQQVTQSSRIASRAVTQAEETDRQVRGLSASAQRIGEVLKLISEIAEQTNLLALNATIEAARAGDAGKGFAVVASEVKELADQTSRATEEIGQQVGDIQAETEQAVTAIRSIGSTITEISEISSGIAAAVEEQSTATDEIAANVEQAATGTQEVTTNILEVTSSAGETGGAATQVTAVAGDLSGKSERLKSKVESFLSQVRAA